MNWFVKCYSEREKKLVDLDIIPYFGIQNSWIAESSTKDEFSERLLRIVRFSFLEDGKYWLGMFDRGGEYKVSPYGATYTLEKRCSIYVKKEGHWEKVWSEAKEIDGLPGFKKITICDQLKGQWDEFVDYCWKHKQEFLLLSSHHYETL